MKDPFGCEEPALLTPCGTGDREAARRVVAARATDPDDLAVLLDMLGLLPQTAAESRAREHPDR
ncbi:hypothetical protein [Streptomyces sp. ISL-94]|uniref:hypothetical protein n=1 Tax=Streptomyces sp. ISL-94 TaxID=2819190 RepID=UPI001BEC2A92|nr:hypothetical protein [Streptomyces sp. ISL-94]MBT2482322.1 hypothetical protein [Streptomyces sp. ISL-94]